MRIKALAAVAACRFFRGLMHIAGRGGTTLPGRIAGALDKNILKEVSEGMDIIVVTGTNGKTTTSAIISRAFAAGGGKCVTNSSGANLLPGVISALACSRDLLGRPKAEHAVIECDEGALKQVVPLISPKVIVVTNLYRDQLDRYGEVTNTLESIRTGIRSCEDSIVCLNADCSLTASLADDAPGRTRFYGIDVPWGSQEDREISDAKYCIHCGAEYAYSYHTYAHLGGFRCPSCGYSRPDADVHVTDIGKADAEGSVMDLVIGGRTYRARMALPAIYNIYNACAAACACDAAGVPAEDVLAAEEGQEAAFGRMERFDLGSGGTVMILVKNPTGCDLALDHVTAIGRDHDLILCLNDETADGHDISWIWDAGFEKLRDDPFAKRVIVSGKRAEDMQLRLRYAGVPEESISMEKDMTELVKIIKNSERPVYILPNYTCMLALRSEIEKATGGREYWQE